MDIENAAPAEQPPVAEIGETTDTYNTPLGDQAADREPKQPEPETEQQKPETKEEASPSKTRREAIERALAKSKEAATDDGKNADLQPKGKAEQPKQEEVPKPADQPAKGQETGQEGQGDDEHRQPGKPGGNDAPVQFQEAARQEWANTPESVRAEVHRSIAELESGLTQYRENHEKYEAIREYDDMATQFGTTVRDALANYTGIEKRLHDDPFGALEQIIANVAAHKGWTNQDGTPVTFRDIAAHYLDMPADQAASRQEAVLRQMSEQIAALTNRSAAFEQSMQEERIREHQAWMQEFAKDHPRLDELGDDIALLLESGRAANMHEAYELADRMNPSSKPLKKEEDPPAAQTREEPRPANPAGQKSISGAPTAGADPRNAGKPSSSRREALEKAARKLR